MSADHAAVVTRLAAAAEMRVLTLTMASSFLRPGHAGNGPPFSNRAEDGSKQLNGS
jgi:hypothetical protein